MSVLVINARAVDPKDRRLIDLTARVRELVRRARFLQMPVAHLHAEKHGAGTALHVPIGRYEPVFKANERGRELPSGLIDFIVRSPSKTIHLVGAASQTYLRYLSQVLTDTGYEARMEAATVVSFEET